MASYFGKIRNSKTFKPSLELICAILNYVFLNASCTLDSYRADLFQALKPTNLSVYKLKKKQEEMQKIITNKDIAPAFLASAFDSSELFDFDENLPCSSEISQADEIVHLRKRKRFSYKDINYSCIPLTQKVVRTAKNTASVATQTLKMYGKITISKSTFNYNCNQIS